MQPYFLISNDVVFKKMLPLDHIPTSFLFATVQYSINTIHKTIRYKWVYEDSI